MREPLSADELEPERIRARRILVIGPTDAGKTTLIRRLYNHWCTRERVLVLDADVGQSDIGPPGTLGLGTGDAPVEDLAHLKELALHFAGVLSPSEDMAQFMWGVERLFRLALSQRPQRLLVDTTGWIWGGALSLKMAKCNLINPDLVIFITKEEVPLLRLLEHSTYPLMVLRPSSKVKVRNAETRRRFRLKRIEDYFRQGKRGAIHLEHLLIMGPIGELKDLENRLVGLLDGAFRTLGTAWITRVDSQSRKANAWIRWIAMGSVRFIKVEPSIG